MNNNGVVKKHLYSTYEHKLEKEVLQEGNIPKHIAIIMDGNRRYATESGDQSEDEFLEYAHLAGKDKLKEVAQWCIDFGIQYLTVYAFSTENFSRDEKEVNFLMDLAKESFIEMADSKLVIENRIKIKALGKIEDLPEDVRKAIDYAEKKTQNYSDRVMSVCIAYGGRQEIVEAAKSIAYKIKKGEIDPESITEKTISEHLYSTGLPDPDLVLRTSGEVRISNFLLWQLAYSELYFTDVYWPGFRKIDFLRAIRSYQMRTRRFGS